jgi:hypothetical protein
MSRAQLIKSRWAMTGHACEVPVRLDDEIDARLF